MPESGGAPPPPAWLSVLDKWRPSLCVDGVTFPFLAAMPPSYTHAQPYVPARFLNVLTGQEKESAESGEQPEVMAAATAEEVAEASSHMGASPLPDMVRTGSCEKV